MYLKGIEVQGFKSFANKLKFEFHNGVTCIVGPNGSGKSNVADAVRWVLGEQRVKQLRGSSMQDVIFAGTETRKPQGYATVSLILDNSDHQLNIDYDEVTVTRRVYRSGESEYLINGNNCRLKDINELFYDTGIGKEGYSIIGQGQIDKILSTKPEDRRELFDEAVGIVKFKRRKNEAMKKLEDEQANMQRVSDIMNELERQVGPLEKQSETARTYLKLREELKTDEINLFCVEQKNLEQTLEQLEESQKVTEEQLAEVRQQEETLRKQYEEVDSRVKELEQQINLEKDEYNKTEVELKALEGQISLITEQIRSEQNSEEHTNRRMLQIQKELDDKENEQQELFAKIINLSKEVAQKNKERDAAEERLRSIDSEIARYDDAIASGKGKIIELLQEKNESAVALQKLVTTREQRMIRKAEIAQVILTGKTRQEQERAAYNRSHQEFDEKKKLEDTYKTKEQELAGQNEAYTNELRKLTADLEKSQQAYHAFSTKAESLKNIAERYEGYGGSIKKIMEAKDRYPGIHGAVADIIQVDKRYEVAVETALGGSIQNIVTETEQVAKQLVEYLKKNKFGRATFLPLDGISGSGKNGVQPEVLKEQGVLGVANTLVKTKPIYDSIMVHLLGRVVVVDTIDHALGLARKYRYTLRIVTLEGELLNPGGAISGGAYKNSSNLLGRKREIEELEEKANNALKEYDSFLARQKEIRDAREVCRKELAEASRKLQEVALELNTLGINMFQMEKKLKDFEAEYDSVTKELQELEAEVSEIDSDSVLLRERIDAIARENEDSERDVANRAESIDGLKESRERAAKRASDLAIEAAEVTQKEEFYQNDRERINQEIEQLELEAEQLKGGKKEISGVIRSKERQIEQIEETIEEGKLHMAQLQESYMKRQEERDRCMTEQKAFFDQSHEISERLNLLSQEQMRLETQHEKLDERITSQIDYLWNEYDMLPSEAEQQAKPLEISVSAAKSRISELKSQIKKLGNVNVNAIDDYKDVLERYTFMKTQYEDLITSEAALQSIIDELDQGMRKQFDEQFAKIQVEFDKVFRELFGGGHGTLELVAGEDVIEAGIRINAQPPGKKLQNMMQLSGGEKALTAISLLFAIQNLKPSPFCLLDEIEAALDDSNVSRYAQYLKKLTEHTQFILITHRRGTMVAADRLYGITMQEKGVSTLVSVNMIEKDLEQ